MVRFISLRTNEKTVAIIADQYIFATPNIKYSLAYVYDAGTQATFGCNVSKVFFKAVSFPRLEKTIFVVLLTPVQSKIGTCVGLACAVGVPAPGVGVVFVLPLFVDVH